MTHEETITTLIEWIKVATPKDAKVLVPISGGSDSALCFWLYTKALPGQTKGVFIGKNLRAKDWFETLGQVEYTSLPIESRHPEIERWAHFLSLSIEEGRILVGSRNRTEDTLGTFSHASKVASILPLVGLWKHQVMELCEAVAMPWEVIDSSRRADPACGRPQRMADIPFEVVDSYLQMKRGLSPDRKMTSEQLGYLEGVFVAQSYKSNLPLRGLVL